VYESVLTSANSHDGSKSNLLLALAELELEQNSETFCTDSLLKVLCTAAGSMSFADTPTSIQVARARKAFASSLEKSDDTEWRRSPLSLFATSPAGSQLLQAIMYVSVFMLYAVRFVVIAVSRLEYIVVGLPESISRWNESLLPLLQHRSQCRLELEYIRTAFVRLLQRHSRLYPSIPRLLRQELLTCLQVAFVSLRRHSSHAYL
jgi:hypothetical protein